MPKKQSSHQVSLGKFEIFATDNYIKGLLDDMTDEEAKLRGMVKAIMGGQARLGVHNEHYKESLRSRPQDHDS